MHTHRVFLGTYLPLVALLLISCGTVTPTTAQEKRDPSLYERLGRYDAIAAVVDDCLGRLSADPRLTRFFVGQSTDPLKRIRQLAVDQVCAAAGGPCVYTGRSLKTSHAGLGITGADWQAAGTLLVASLDKYKVPREKNELLAIVASLREDIVEK